MLLVLVSACSVLWLRARADLVSRLTSGDSVSQSAIVALPCIPGTVLFCLEGWGLATDQLTASSHVRTCGYVNIQLDNRKIDSETGDRDNKKVSEREIERNTSEYM